MGKKILLHKLDMINENSHYGLMDNQIAAFKFARKHPELFSPKKISEEKERQYKIQAAMRVAFWRVWFKEHRRPEGAYTITDIYREE